MSEVKITQGAIVRGTMSIKIGGIRIEISHEDYQAMLEEIDQEIAARNAEASNKYRIGQKRISDSWQAVEELREILYEHDDGSEFYILRNRPDDKKLEAFLDKYAKLMDFDR